MCVFFFTMECIVDVLILLWTVVVQWHFAPGVLAYSVMLKRYFQFQTCFFFHFFILRRHPSLFYNLLFLTKNNISLFPFLSQKNYKNDIQKRREIEKRSYEYLIKGGGMIRWPLAQFFVSFFERESLKKRRW